MLDKVLKDGASWEVSSEQSISMFISAVKGKVLKRMIGTKAAKTHELLSNTSPVLNETRATTYRASAVRANYLALDRPDRSFAEISCANNSANPRPRT